MIELPIRNPFPNAKCFYVRETTSTMEAVRSLPDDHNVHGTFVMTDMQTKGRGRLPGKIWESEMGKSLLFTIILDVQNILCLPLLIGLAVARSIEKHTIPFKKNVRIKWPNDVLVDTCKIAGILCEHRHGRVFAGIGINCNQRLFENIGKLNYPPVSLLNICQKSFDRLAFLEELLENISYVLVEEDWRTEVEQRLAGVGKNIVFSVGTGNMNLNGRINGIGEKGELIMEIPGKGKRSFFSGEIKSSVGISGIDGNLTAQ